MRNKTEIITEGYPVKVNNLKGLLRLGRYPHLSVWAISLFSVIFAETLMLEMKYNVFSGGFLQAHPVNGLAATVALLSLVFVINALFYGFITLFWVALAGRFNARIYVSAYHLLWFMLSFSFFVLAARYKVSAYFGDFISFSVIKNLGGGSLYGAILYAINEGTVSLFVVGLFLIIWIVTAKRVSSISKQCGVVRVTKKTYVVGVFIAFVVVINLANPSKNLRVHLQHTTVYSATHKLLAVLIKNDTDALTKLGDNFNKVLRPIPDYRYNSRIKKHILLIVLESVRGDALYKRVGSLNVMPTLMRLAEQGCSSEKYYSHTAFTTTSLNSIFTGAVMGINNPKVLLKTLKDAGYKIISISGQDETFGDIAKQTGTLDFSDEYFDASIASEKRAYPSATPGSLVVPNEVVVQRFFLSAKDANWSQPQFFYLNFQSAHFPYYYPGMKLITTKTPIKRTEISAKNRLQVQDTYWNAVANADDSVKDILAFLDSKQLLENTLVVVVGDHGESLFEDNLLGHGFKITPEQMRTIFVSNVRGLAPVHPFGHENLSDLIIRGSGAEGLSPDSTLNDLPVLHIVGNLYHPDQIGHTYAEGQTVVIDSEDLSFQVTTHGVTKFYIRTDVEADASLKAVYYALIQDWQTKRWESNNFSASANMNH